MLVFVEVDLPFLFLFNSRFENFMSCHLGLNNCFLNLE